QRLDVLFYGLYFTQEPNGLVFALCFLPATLYIKLSKNFMCLVYQKSFCYAKPKFISHLALGYRPTHA
ncbi:hypothetical protein, partial [Bacillus pseudomycoides]|uniref:hypothetical protein n=1 Tax=Bacillus pseudomycoides TaxID=64104 RepID=UPI001C54D327